MVEGFVTCREEHCSVQQARTGIKAGGYPRDSVELRSRGTSSRWKFNRHWLGTYSMPMANGGLRCARPGLSAGIIG